MPIVVKVKDVMDKKIVELEHDKTVVDAIKAMLDNGVWSIIVTKDGLPVGVVTERDIFRRVLAKGRNVNRVTLEEIMSSPLITISPEDPIGKAMEIMASKNVRRIYVVKEGKIIGRVTQTVAFKHLTNVLIALHEMMADL